MTSGIQKSDNYPRNHTPKNRTLVFPLALSNIPAPEYYLSNIPAPEYYLDKCCSKDVIMFIAPLFLFP
jgi:hypothetical protein